LKSGEWNKQMGSLLSGKRVGVLGVGRIGKKVSELLVAFGAKVTAFDPYEDQEWSSRHNVQYETNFNKFISNMDIITIHSSYNEEMKHLFNKELFQLSKDNLLLVNLSRGEMINEVDLASALEGGIISGAALDVFEKEPYIGPLSNQENVILTPHIGSYARETRIQMEKEAVENLLSKLL
jgi:D-3-phosphoglycerate dehydrogenase